MPGLSIETSVMPFLMAIALTCAALSATSRRDDGSLQTRRLRRIDVQRNPVLPHRQHAARMQHLGAVAGDLLRLVVVQGAQQPRASARRAGLALNMPGTSVQISRRAARSLAAKYAAGGIGAAAAEQHRVAVARWRR